MAARKNHAFERAIGSVGTHPLVRHVTGMHLTVHVSFPNTPGNELGDLRTKIKNENFLVLHG